MSRTIKSQLPRFHAGSFVYCVAVLALLGCGRIEVRMDAENDTDTTADSEFDTGEDTETNHQTDSDPETDSDTATASDTDVDSDTDTDNDTDTDSDSDSDTDTETSTSTQEISWTVSEFKTVDEISDEGLYVDAVNFGGAEVTVGGVVFVGYPSDTGDDFASDHLSTKMDLISGGNKYNGEVEALEPILDNYAWDNVKTDFVLKDLEVGRDYLVQLFLVDNNEAEATGRYAVVDGILGGPETTVIGGATALGLLFTGEFTAATDSKLFTLEVFDQLGGNMVTQLNAFQLRMVE